MEQEAVAVEGTIATVTTGTQTERHFYGTEQGAVDEQKTHITTLMTGTQTNNAAESVNEGQNLDPSTTCIPKPSSLTSRTQTELDRYPTSV